ncbi:hypothetical protein [Actinomadura welshii]|uniref:hypothetical protein n=1 Tax=Actinomadura welshii TaxID=3103817 RepID=UPI0003AD6B3B|nr:hypothetical protein [Actinomadura madurae]
MTGHTQHHDGAHQDDQDTVRLVAELSEHVRRLNHATAGPPGLSLPSTTYTVLGILSADTYGLDQTLEQVTCFFLREGQAGRLGHDHGEELTEVLRRHGQAPARARWHTHALCAGVSEAHAEINAVHGCLVPTYEDQASAYADAREPEGAGVTPAAADFLKAVNDSTLLPSPRSGDWPSTRHSPRTSAREVCTWT